MSFFKTIKDGVKYMEIWPEEPLLNPIFPENRVKTVMKIGRYVLPPFIVFILFWSFVQGGGLKGIEFMFIMKNNWPMTIICVLFLLFMPLQGYYWFGRRSQTKLNKKLHLFYEDVCKKLCRPASADPTQMDLAIAIKDGIKQLGRDFLRKL